MHLLTPLGELTPEDCVGDRKQLRDAARYMALRGGPSSPESMAMIEALLAELIVAPAMLDNPLRPSSLRKSREAMGAVLADLLLI